MLGGYQIIDGDAHVFEPPEMWKEYLEPEFKKFAPSSELMIQGKKIYRNMSSQVSSNEGQQILKKHPDSVLTRFNSESQVQALKAMGVDVAFQYPSHGLWILGVDTMPPNLASAFTRAYNNWLKDFCSYAPEFLKGVGAINLHEPETMISELQRVASFGWTAVCLLPNPVKGRILSHPQYASFWQACEEMNMAVALHTAAHAQVPTVGDTRFQTRFALHTCAHPMEQMMALLAVIEGGVLEQHPNLKMGFLESGCGWLPYWLWRMDEEYDNLYWEVKSKIKKKPSEYFRRQCFISFEPSEPCMEHFVEVLGWKNLIFGSDYPHVDHNPSIVSDAVSLDSRLTKQAVKEILWDNAAHFYGLS